MEATLRRRKRGEGQQVKAGAGGGEGQVGLGLCDFRAARGRQGVRWGPQH